MLEITIDQISKSDTLSLTQQFYLNDKKTLVKDFRGKDLMLDLIKQQKRVMHTKLKMAELVKQGKALIYELDLHDQLELEVIMRDYAGFSVDSLRDKLMELEYLNYIVDNRFTASLVGSL